jgi:ssDNA-specific exonuclease RecJ
MKHFNIDVKGSFLYKFDYFLIHNIPADNELLPFMIHFLNKLHSSNNRLNQLYLKLQVCILNYFKTQGSNFYFNDSKEILKGTKEFDIDYALSTIEERRERSIVKVPGPFGLENYRYLECFKSVFGSKMAYKN